MLVFVGVGVYYHDVLRGKVDVWFTCVHDTATSAEVYSAVWEVILRYTQCRWLSDSDGKCGRLVRQVAQILEGTRVAKDN